MRKIKLENLLKKNGVGKDDVIKWQYYGYGILQHQGESKVSELNINVLLAKCFAVEDGVYKVDGAL